MKYFIGHDHSLSSDDSRRAVVNFWRKNMHKYWFIMAPSYEFYISYLTKVKYFSLTAFLHTVEPQWLEYLWDHKNSFATWVVRATKG